jgi:hypothetical protein
MTLGAPVLYISLISKNKFASCCIMWNLNTVLIRISRNRLSPWLILVLCQSVSQDSGDQQLLKFCCCSRNDKRNLLFVVLYPSYKEDSIYPAFRGVYVMWHRNNRNFTLTFRTTWDVHKLRATSMPYYDTEVHATWPPHPISPVSSSDWRVYLCTLL